MSRILEQGTLRLLIVDDERSMRDMLAIFLRKKGMDVSLAGNGEEAMTFLKCEQFDIIISDVRMGEVSGLDLLQYCREEVENPPEFILMTAFSSTADAINATEYGAFDYFTKPFKLEKIEDAIRRAAARRRERKGPGESQILSMYDFSNIIGESPQIRTVFEMIRRVADTNTNVLITGESGTGKELVARAIHNNSQRRNLPFVSVNCGAIPSELMESELFGHKKGSFTGAYRDKEGLFKTASSGTLFLDEIAEMPILLQVKLLRALQERRIQPVGAVNDEAVDARVVAATNRNLRVEAQEGRFREDLYYRLNVIQISLPPLRERKGDLPLLVDHFIRQASRQLGKEPLRMSQAAMMVLSDYAFPGNIRELNNIIERAVTLENSSQISPKVLPPYLLNASRKQGKSSSSTSLSATNSPDSYGLADTQVPINLEEAEAVNAQAGDTVETDAKLKDTPATPSDSQPVLTPAEATVEAAVPVKNLHSEVDFGSEGLDLSPELLGASLDWIDPADGRSVDVILQNIERELLTQALRQCNGVRTEAAKRLGLTFRSLRYRLDKLGIGGDDAE